ncbi:MAG: GNAT family N-acetyltransferase [Aquihabitans sp.]
MSTIRPATASDIPAVGRILASAFLGDPLMEWLVPRSDRFEERAAPWFAADAAAKLTGHGEVHVDCDMRGAAIWSSPDHWKGTLREAVQVLPSSVRLFGTKLPRGIRTLMAMERDHPKDPPHWYLAVIGTHRDHQGKGVGGALLTAVLDRCDEQGLPAYLESSKQVNVAFYARYGFEVTKEHVTPGGPPMWLMWREPR